MRGIGVILLAVLVAVQARSTGVEKSSGWDAAPGESPYVVHLRIARSNSGLLSSCVGALYSNTIVLTSASCAQDARFIWIRYAAQNVLTPELVTETSSVVLHPNYNQLTGENDIALIRINRVVQYTENIAPVPVASDPASVTSAGKLCAYGSVGNNPGEQLKCVELSLEVSEKGDIIASDAATTQFDLGAPLVSGGVQYGILVQSGQPSVFLNAAKYSGWIATQSRVGPFRSIDGDFV